MICFVILYRIPNGVNLSLIQFCMPRSSVFLARISEKGIVPETRCAVDLLYVL